MRGRGKPRHAHQNKGVVPLAAKHIGRGEACVSKKFLQRSKWEHEEKLDSLDVAASSQEG